MKPLCYIVTVVCITIGFIFHTHSQVQIAEHNRSAMEVASFGKVSR